MAREPALRERNPWLIAFILAVAAVASAFVFLAFVTFDAISEGESTAVAPADGTSASSTPGLSDPGVTFSGSLPRTAEGLGLRPAEPGKQADIEFSAAGTDAETVIVRYLVPVAAIGAGVDALTADQFRMVFLGEITDWATVSGIAGKIRPYAGSPGDVQVTLGWLSTGQSQATAVIGLTDGYEALREEMSLDSGVVAVVPIEELRPNMVAITIDGADIARGIGDPRAWSLGERVAVIGHTNKGKDTAAAIRDAIAAKPPVVTRIVATGDVLQSRCSLAAIKSTGDWGAALRGPVGEFLAGADLALSSLDGSIQGIGEPYLCVVQEYPNLTSPPEVIEGLTLAGIDEMTLATNHAFDCGLAGCGSKALLESQSRLNAAGIKTVGGGKNLEDALAPAIFEVNGIRIGVLGFDDIAAEDLEATETEPGTAPLDDSYADEKADPPAEPAFYKPASLLGVTRLQERIRLLKAQVDVVVVQIQSGTEDTHAPSPRSIKALRAAADAGADLIVGNQAHWVQAIEVRDQRFIAYALGNFIFDQVRTPEHTQGYLLEATFHGKQLATIRMVPYQIENRYKPTFATGDLRAKVLGDVVEASLDLPAR